MKITCIIPTTFNQQILPFLNQCLESLIKSAKLAHINITVIVVSINHHPDNFNQGKHLQYLKVNKKNNSFSKMNNIAIEKSLKKHNPDYLLLINDDAWVKKNFFQKMKELLKLHNPDVISPIIYKHDSSKIDSFGLEYFPSGYAMNSQSMRIKTTLLSACCVLINSTLLIKVKKKFGHIFNPTINYYMEDVELFIRIRSLKANLVKSNQLVAYHAGQNTSGNIPFFGQYYNARNILWVILLSWPKKVILKNLIKISIFHFWIVIAQFSLLFPLIYIKMLTDTIHHLDKLLYFRKKNLSSYEQGFLFEKLFSPYTFRGRRLNILIK